MKRSIGLILLVVALCCGCAALKQAKTDMYDCMNDQACLDMAIAKSEAVKKQVTAVAGVVSPIPWVSPVLGAVGGSIALLGYLVIGGRKKREDGK